LRLGVSSQHCEYFGTIFVVITFVHFVVLVDGVEVVGFEGVRLCEVEAFWGGFDGAHDAGGEGLG
jgi:hypothetical protein